MWRLLFAVAVAGGVGGILAHEAVAQQRINPNSSSNVAPQQAVVNRPQSTTLTRPQAGGPTRTTAQPQPRYVPKSSSSKSNSTPTRSSSGSPSTTSTPQTIPYYYRHHRRDDGDAPGYPLVYNPWASNGPGSYGYPPVNPGSDPYSYSPYSNPYYSGYPPYGYNYYRYPYYAPIFAPTWQLYGPWPIMQMMGVGSWFSGNGGYSGGGNGGGNFQGDRPIRQPVQPRANVGNDADSKPPAADQGDNRRSPDMAIRYIGFGDTHFGNQKYPDALDRYKKAVQADPQNADGWFRQAFALSAMGRYEQATKALKRGLEINPDWGKSDFRLSEVYGNNDDLKQSNLDAMEKDVAANPNNGDAALMLAIHYHFDGKQDQAAPLLQRALKVVGNDGVVGGFLGK